MMVEVLLPTFNSLVNRKISLTFATDQEICVAFAGIVLLVGLCGGMYPAFFLSSFQPLSMLGKSARPHPPRSGGLRSVLVMLQFAASVILVISTLVMFTQLSFIKNKDLGMDKEHLVFVPLKEEVRKNFETIKTAFLNHAAVLAASATSFMLRGTIFHEGFSWDNGEQSMMIDRISIDDDFLHTFKIELVNGRNFSRTFPADATQAYMLNETAAKYLGWTNPIGKEVAWNGRRGTIVGVVKDFHYKSLHHPVAPLLITNRPSGFSHLVVKIQSTNIRNTLRTLEQTWESIVPDYPFEYTFCDEDFDRLYRAEMRIEETFQYFSMLAIVVSSLGLLGLSA
jgi:hypothetical protein